MSNLASCSQKISELIELLNEESNLLKKGQLDGLQDIQKSKAKGVSDLEAMMSSLPPEDDIISIAPRIQTLKRLADENGAILKSVMNGLRSARERLKALQHNEAKVGAYNKVGAGLFLAEGQVFSEKRV